MSRRLAFLAVLAASLISLADGRLTAGRTATPWQSVLLYLLGAGLFLWLAHAARQPLDGALPGSRSYLGRLMTSVGSNHPGRMGLVAAALVLLLSALHETVQAPSNGPDQWLAFLAWLASILFLVLACCPARHSRIGLRESLTRLSSCRIDLAVMVALAAIALLLRLLWRDTVPYPISGDEVSVGMDGLRIVRGESNNMFVTGWSDQPNLSFLLPGLFQWAFGADISGLRAFPAVVGSLGVVMVYLLSLELWGRPVALVAAAYLAAYHFHIHFSRIAVSNINDPTLMAASFYFLWRGLRKGLVLDFAIAGMVAGLAVYSYAGGRLLVALIAVVLAFLAVRDRGFLRRWRLHLLALGASLLVTTAPILLFFAGHPNQAAGRMNQVGIFQNGWLASQLSPPAKSLFGILWDQFSRSFFVFTNVPASNGFYNSPEPLLDLAASLLFMVGLAWSLWHWRTPSYFVVDLWFFSVIAGATVTVDPPNVARMVAATPAVAMLIAVGLVQVAEVVASFTPIPPRLKITAISVLTLLLCVVSLRFYFLEYTPKHYFADANGELVMEAGYYLRAAGPAYKVYFFGRPRVFFDAPTLRYLRGSITGIDGPDTLPTDLSFVDHDKGAIFIFIPERREEASQVERLLPGGKLTLFARKTSNQTLFIAYKVDRAVLARK